MQFVQPTTRPTQNSRRSSTPSRALAALALLAGALALSPASALATANYVYHERTGNDATGGNVNTCGGPQTYVPALDPDSSQAYVLRFKVEYQFFTDTLRVYYTTDGSTPAGTLGVGNVGTLVVSGNYQCLFTDGPNQVDVCNATIPAQPAGTVVKYIISARHSGGGPEIFANSGEFISPFDSSDEATVFQYTVASTTDLYWDANGSTAGAGGATPTGIWGTDNFWSGVPDGTSETGAWVAGRNAVFSAGANATGSFNVGLNGTQTTGNISLEEGAVTITNGTISLGSGAVAVAAGASLTMSNVVSGSAGLVKSGSGTLTLAVNNTYSGGTLISGGVLAITADAGLGAAPGAFTPTAVTLADSTTLRLAAPVIPTITANRGVTLTGSGASFDAIAGGIFFIPVVIDGPGATVTKTGPGEVGFYGAANTFAKLVIDQGNLRIGQATFAGSDLSYGAVPAVFTPDAITIRNGATNRVVGSTAVVISPNRGITLGAGGGVIRNDVSPVSVTINSGITGPGGLRKEGGQAMIINGGMTYAGSTIFNAGTVTINGTNATGGDFIVNAGTVNNNGPGTGTGNLRVNGGRMTLNNTTLFSSVTQTNGRIDVNTNGCLPAGPISISPETGSSIIFVNASLVTPSAVTLVNDMTLTPSSGASTIDIAANSGRQLILNGKISGSANWQKNNGGSSGSVFLGNAANDFTGNLTIVAGPVVATANNALGAISGITTVTNLTTTPFTSGTLGFAGGIDYTASELVAVSGNGFTNVFGLGGVGLGAIASFGGDNRFAGPVALAANAAVGATNGAALNLAGTIGETAIGRVLTKLGAGTVTLSAANSYSGGTLISNGTLRAANTTGSATGPGPISIFPGGSLSGPGSVAGTVTVNGVLSPGSSPGTLNTGSEIWNGGGTYLWEINDAAGTQGADPGWDFVNITGTLTINATPGSKFNINVTSLTLGNVAGSAANFNNAIDQVWTIATASGGITGFDAAAFNVVSSNFLNPIGSGVFLVEQSGNNILLRFLRRPFVTVDPVGGAFPCLGSVGLSVTADGTAPLSYQWRKGGLNLADGGNISGALTTALIVNPSAISDGGSYDVVVTNPYGSVTSAVAVVTVADVTPPVAVCQNISVNLVGSSVSITPAMVNNGSSDSCGSIILVSVAPDSFGCTNVGANVVTLTVSDGNGNTNTCNAVVTVVDNTAPVITQCATPQTVNAGPGCTALLSDLTPLVAAMDNCAVSVTVVQDPAPGSVLPIGTNLVTFSVSDGNGNTNTCTQTVFVQESPAAPPVIAIPSDVTLECDLPLTTANTGAATATDNCDPNPAITFADLAVVTVSSNAFDGWAIFKSGFPLTAVGELVNGPAVPPLGTGSFRAAVGANGENVVEIRSSAFAGATLGSLTELSFSAYRAVDGDGGDQGIHMILIVDSDGNGSADDTLFFELEYQDGDNPALPNQGAILTGTWQSWNALAGGWWSFSNPGLMSPGAGVESLATYITAFPSARIVNTLSGGGVRLGGGGSAGVRDNFEGGVDRVVIGTNGVAVVYNFDLGPATSCRPLVARTWKATDDSGNSAFRTQVIKQQDTTAPVITCPANIAVNNDPGVCTAVVTFAPTGVDACSVNLTSACAPASGSAFPVGVTTVTCWMADDCGNTNSCTFTVTVNDTIPPVIVTCAPPQTVPVLAGCAAALPDFTGLVSATDSCTSATVTQVPAPGTVLVVGSHTITYTATDLAGNTNACVSTVTIVDTIPPVAVCQNISVNLTGTSIGITPADVNNGSSDNCGTVILVSVSPATFTCANLGANTVTLTVSDGHGNTNTCTATVTVVDTAPPVAVCQNISVSLVGSSVTITPAAVDNGSSDNCGSVILVSVVPDTFTCANLGPNAVTLTVSDGHGNTNTCAATVTVQDTTPPVVTCPANILVKSLVISGAPVTFSASATDNCTPAPAVTCVPVSGSNFPIGATAVTCSSSDASGNSNSCTFTVTVLLQDNETTTVNAVIPDNNPNGFASTINVASQIGILADVKVDVLITNGWNGDLYAYLVHDSGFSVLLNRTGRRAADTIGYGDSGFNVTFADGAANGDIHAYRFTLSGNHTTPVAGPLSGSWAPDGRATDPALVLDTDARTEPLSSFNGLNPNGAWTLFIADVEGGDQSTLVSWGLELCGYLPVPVSVPTQSGSLAVECTAGTTLIVTTAGTGPLTNQWYFNGSAINGANGLSLAIPAVNPGSTGVYSFAACNMAGCATSAPIVLTLADTTPPVITCSGNVMVPCAGLGTPATFVVTATDTCSPTTTVMCLPPSGSLFPQGTNTVVCTATDDYNNAALCSFSVIVVPYRTNYLVNVSVPDNNPNGIASTKTVATTIGILTDVNVGITLSGGWNGDLYAYLVHDSGFSVLLNRVGRRGADSLGYGDSGFDVLLDDQAASGDIHNYRATLFANHATPLAGALTNRWAPDGRATDPGLVLNTDARTELLSSFNGLNPNGEWTLYLADLGPLDTSTLVSWNLELCGLPPIPASITLQPQSQTVNCSTSVSFPVAVAGTAPFTNQWYLNGSPLPGATSSNLNFASVSVANSGTYRLVTANMVGSVTSAPAVLVVIDTPPGIVCPANITAEVQTPAGAVVTFAPAVSDDCTPGIVPVCAPSSGSVFPLGSTTVNCSATDFATNISSCSFIVTVVDTLPPSLCIDPPVTFAAGGNDGFSGPQAASPSSNLVYRLRFNDQRGFDDAATDAWFGHTVASLPAFAADATLRIRLRGVAGDTTNDTIILGFVGAGGALQPPQWSRSLGRISGSDGGLLGSPWPAGVANEFVLDLSALPNADGTTTDILPGLRQYGSLDIMVQDDTAVDYVELEVRSCQCAAGIVQTIDPGTCGATVNFPIPAFTDLFDPTPAIVCSPAPGTVFPVGTNMVLCTASDVNGNTNTCGFTVVVNDIVPVLTITRAGANIVICWPATCAINTLESTASLNPVPVWSQVATPPVLNGNQYCVTLPIQPGNRFFRLRRF